MYEMFNQISFTNVGKDGTLKLHEAAGLMMDCCQFQEYQEQGLCEYLRNNQIAVFLSSIQIDIHRLPQFREKVRTAVKIYDCKSIFGLRRITIHDENGGLCCIANAAGAFFDLRAGKAVKLDPAVFNVEFDEAEPMECLPRKIPVPSANGIAMPAQDVTASMLDYNGHLTSPVYFAIAGDCLPDDFRYNRVRIEYKKQAKPGDTITPMLHLTDSCAVVDMKDDEGNSYAIAEFTEILFK